MPSGSEANPSLRRILTVTFLDDGIAMLIRGEELVIEESEPSIDA
jgi:hypothetical protein